MNYELLEELISEAKEDLAYHQEKLNASKIKLNETTEPSVILFINEDLKVFNRLITEQRDLLEIYNFVKPNQP